MKPKISIVVPARNEESCLPRLFKRVEDGEFSQYEVIVVDGGSTDKTRSIAEDHGAKVIRGPQKGPSIARNIGWQEAEADYIVFLDADWYIENGELENIVDIFKTNPKVGKIQTENIHIADNWVSKAISAENKAGGKRDNFVYSLVGRLLP